MKKGERATFTVPPETAYGEIGSPPTVPPNVTLIFRHRDDFLVLNEGHHWRWRNFKEDNQGR